MSDFLPSSALTMSNGSILPSGYMSMSTPGGGSDFLSQLLGGGFGSQGNTFTDIGSLLGKSAQADAQNRYVQGQFQQNADRTAIDAQANERANNAADLKQLAQTSYILGGGSKFNPGTLSLNGRTYNVNTMGLGPQPISNAQTQGAHSLQDTVLQNLAKGGSLKNGSTVATPVSSFATPSAGEKAKGFLGGAASGAGIGSTFGPIGAGVGGVLGGLLSLF